MRYDIEHRKKISEALKGNKNSLGVKHSQEFKDACKKRRLGKKYPYKPRPSFKGRLNAENNPIWKGDKASYTAIHKWIANRLGRGKICSHCGKEGLKKYEWANLDHKYKRDLKDWIRLCTKCHRKYDKDNGFKINQW